MWCIRRTAPLVLVALLVVGCGRSRDDQQAVAGDTMTAGQLPAPDTSAPPASSGFDTLPTVRTAPAGTVAVLDTALVDASGRSVVFTFRNRNAPGIDARYVPGPVHQCGSGEPVAVSGNAFLLVRFTPADAHVIDGERAIATITERTRDLDGPIVVQMTMICDFEGQVEWILGMRGVRPYQIVTRPGVLVVEFAGSTATLPP